jgi:ElaB/YqjD/DUF883 family membrane-anchored ribosome-binding protein
MRCLVTAIRGDAGQTITRRRAVAAQLSNELWAVKSAKPAADSLVSKTISLVNSAICSRDDALQTRRDRFAFLSRAVAAGAADRVRLQGWARDLELQCEVERVAHNENVEALRVEWTRTEHLWRAKLEIARQQLKSLSQFRERRDQLEQQRRQVADALQRGKRENSVELKQIHRILVDQREAFERELAARLEVADKFVADFADLHIDVATQRIADECRELRGQMDDENDSALKLLTENDMLQNRLKKLEERRKIFTFGFERAQKLDTRLADRAAAVEAQMQQRGSEFSESIRTVKDNCECSVKELRSRLQDLRDANVQLKQDAAVAARDLAAAEDSRFERLRTDCDILQAIKDAAVFVLAALDRRYGPDDGTIRRRSELTEVIRRLATIKIVKGVVREVRDTTDVAVQTDRPGKVLAPRTAKIAASPRFRGTHQRFQDMPDYRRVYGQPSLGHDWVRIRIG